MLFTTAQIEHYRTRGYVSGPRVLSAGQVEVLKERIDDILHCRTFHGSYGNRTDNPRRSYIMHLMPGHTRRLGDNWNERMGDVETVGVGEIVRGPDYPELVAV